MTQLKPDQTGYSADIDLWMECNGSRIPLATVASSFVRPQTLTLLNPGVRATVCVRVNDFVKRRAVVLDDGMSSVDDATPVRPLDDVPF